MDGETFISANKPVAGTEKPTFLFERKSGELIFDANGSNDGGQTTIAKVLFNSQQYLDINDMLLT